MPGNIERFSDATRAFTKEYALNTAFNRESARCSHALCQFWFSREASLTRSASIAFVLASIASRRATP